MSGINLTDALSDLSRQGLAGADKHLVVEVAKAVWYSANVPNLGNMPAQLRADAGYIVDRLARFNVLPKWRKLQLLAALEPYKRLSPPSTGSSCRDPLAIAWGASADLTVFMPDLLPYQTRHFAATQ